MVEFTASHFDDLCRQAPVQAQIGSIEQSRKSALGRFWLYGLGGLVLAVVLGWLAGAAAGETVGVFVFFVLLVAAIVAATRPLARASEAIKHPVLEALAAQGGMDYLPDGFDPPVFAEAHKPLFGSWLSSSSFTDLFHGQDPEGRRFAVYEGTLSRGSGKHRRQVFSGQIYAFQRRRRATGQTVAVPDRGLFNFFKPSGGFQRVRIENDPDFEKRFEIYSTFPQEAGMLFGSVALRRLLLELRQSGRIFAYVGPQDVLVAVTGRNRFEPGSMFRARGGGERVRSMFDDVCESLKILKELRAALG